jgi:CheY-like chemotaxis protein
MSPGTHHQAVVTLLCTSDSDVRGPASATVCSGPSPIARILVSEDNPGIQRIYSGLLPNHGFELIYVPNGDGSLTIELAKCARPQLVITDINKPTMDGHALVASLHAEPSTAHIPVLMVTAMDEQGEPRRAGRPSSDDYIVKPFPFEDLLYRITTMIDWVGSARDDLVGRAVGLPCYDHHHPATGLPCLHQVAAGLPARSAHPGWAAIEVSFANHRELIGAYGRPMVDGFAGRLGGAVRRAVGPGLLAGHTGFDLGVIILGPVAQVAAAEALLLERLASLTRPRTIFADAPVVQLALHRANDRAGFGLSLPALRAALA